MLCTMNVYSFYKRNLSYLEKEVGVGILVCCHRKKRLPISSMIKLSPVTGLDNVQSDFWGVLPSLLRQFFF